MTAFITTWAVTEYQRTREFSARAMRLCQPATPPINARLGDIGSARRRADITGLFYRRHARSTRYLSTRSHRDASTAIWL